MKKRLPICVESLPMPAEVLPLALSAARPSMLAHHNNHRRSVRAITCLVPSWQVKVVRPGLRPPRLLPKSSSSPPSIRCLPARLRSRDHPHHPHHHPSSSRPSSSIPRVPDPAASRHNLRRRRRLLAPVREAASDVRQQVAQRPLRSMRLCLTRARDSRLRFQRTLRLTTLGCSNIRHHLSRFKPTR